MIRCIVPVYNQLEFTKQCLRSLKDSTDLPLEIVVVDNASNDGTKEYLDTLENVKVIHNENNLGFGNAMNQGMKLEPNSCTHYLLLNNDTIVPKNLIDRLVETIEGRKDIGIVGPMSNFAGGSQGVNIKYDLDKLNEFSEEFYNKHKGIREVGVVVGICMLVKKEVIDKVGYFDVETFGKALWEDNDLCIRIRNNGYKCMINTGTFIHHYGSITITADPSYQFQFVINKAKFLNKWNNIYNSYGKKLVGVMRVKNGEPWVRLTLEKCSQFCDEIIVLDDNSTDNTYNICKEFPKVIRLEKNEDRDFDEARDRNKILQWAKERGADWCYIIDHDEVPEDKLIKKIRYLLNPKDPMTEAYAFKICHLWNKEDQVRVDGPWGEFWQVRLFKVKPFHKIERSEDGLHCGNSPYIPQDCIKYSFHRIKHYGNMDPVIRQKKYEWYTKTDVSKDVGMILGGWENYYKKLYNKKILEDSDYYRHIIDETGLQLFKWEENNNVSLCMIVRDEERWLGKCLDSVKDIVDEIIIGIDDRTKDNTKIVALQYTDKVFDYKWNEEGFAGARNFVTSKASGKWILRMDADEVIPEMYLITLAKMIQSAVDAFLFPIRNILSMDAKKWTLSETIRLYRNLPDLKYVDCVHEDFEKSFEEYSKKGRTIKIARSPIEIVHLGYLRDAKERQDKYDFYAQLALKQIKDNPSDAKALYNLGVHYYTTGDKGKAAYYYRKAVKFGHWMACNDLGIVFLQKGNLILAKRLFEKSLEMGSRLHVHEFFRSKVVKNMEMINNLLNSTESAFINYR